METSRKKRYRGAPGWLGQWSVRLLMSGVLEFEPCVGHRVYLKTNQQYNVLRKSITWSMVPQMAGAHIVFPSRRPKELDIL